LSGPVCSCQAPEIQGHYDRKRDANADPMLRLFSFNNPPFITPPVLPAAPVDLAHVMDSRCVTGVNGAR
jgi:hypothetical protein